MKRFQPIAGGIAKRNQRANASVVGKLHRFGGNGDACAFQPRRERVQRSAVSNLPAEEARAFAHRAVDDDTLLAVVHPEGEL